MDTVGDVREFLASRRARITPEQAGLPNFGGTRRVAGLRCAEVALVAGVSPDYYTRLERGNTAEIDVVAPAPGRADARTPIWIVAVDGDLYVRSWKGDDGIWYRRARRHGTGSIVANSQEHPVRFTAVGEPGINARVDAAYRSKYGNSPYTQAMTGEPATATTTRLDPA